jgi:hypothetical protein
VRFAGTLSVADRFVCAWRVQIRQILPGDILRLNSLRRCEAEFPVVNRLIGDQVLKAQFQQGTQFSCFLKYCSRSGRQDSVASVSRTASGI